MYVNFFAIGATAAQRIKLLERYFVHLFVRMLSNECEILRFILRNNIHFSICTSKFFSLQNQIGSTNDKMSCAIH